MKWQGKHLRSLMRLLDEVDRYEDMLNAIAVLDRLETVNIERNLNSALQNRSEILEAIHLTRDNLIAGLTTEKSCEKIGVYLPVSKIYLLALKPIYPWSEAWK